MENVKIDNEVKRLFWHDLYLFQVERATKLIQFMATVLGDDVIKVLQETNVDWHEPLRLYMKNTIMMIEKLKELYGEKVTDLIREFTSNEAFQRGQAICANGDATLDDVLRIFGTEGTVLSKNKSEAVISRPGCLTSQVARELGVELIMYCLHCYGDSYYVKGINPNISCEHNKTFMLGDDCCEYLLSMIP